MKKLLISSLLFACVLLSAQEGELRPIVDSSFKAMYPDSRLEDWWTEDGQYHICFTITPHSCTAVFDSTGIWMETSEIISDFDIPLTLKNYLKQNYPCCTISYCEKVETKESLRFIRVNFYNNNQLMIIQCDNTGRNIRMPEP